MPHGPPGSSIERLPSDRDTDTADDWWIQPAPSPGRQGDVHDDPPPLIITEVMPAPSNIDWDSDGTPGHLDEFIEIHNPAPYPVDLRRWVIADGQTDGWEHRFERGDRLVAGGYLAVFRTTSGIALDNDGDTVRLVRPDGVEADRYAWTGSPGYDRSFSRTDIGGTGWSAEWDVTPGQPNHPLAPGEPHPADVAWEARKVELGWTGRSRAREGGAEPLRFAVALSDIGTIGRRTRVVVRGRVMTPPGVFGPREVYIGDGSGGVRLYLRRSDHVHRPFVLGDPVAAIGKIADFRGERQVVLDRPEDAWWDGVGGDVAPNVVDTGDVGEDAEGRLIQTSGRVVGFSARSFTLDDGSGPARIVIRPATGLSKPWVERGEWRSVVGLVGQSAARAPWEGGYRVTPRVAADLDPVVGGGGQQPTTGINRHVRPARSARPMVFVGIGQRGARFAADLM